jgi:hypothetical protein
MIKSSLILFETINTYYDDQNLNDTHDKFNIDKPSYGDLDKPEDNYPILNKIDNGGYQQLSDNENRKDYDRQYFSDAKLRFDAMRKKINYRDDFKYNTNGYLDIKE